MNDDYFCVASNPQEYQDCFRHWIEEKNPNEPEFIQAASEILDDLVDFVFDKKEYLEARILERIMEPDRVISFRVMWEDDQNQVRINRGYRVQFNNTIGPYKGGLRFHPTVNQSILKFLGLEQILKNSLTTLPMGAAKGGADFNPKGKSEREIMRFCQSFMTELHRYIGEDVDIPAGDIGVGEREIAFLFGEYKRIENRFAGVLTGKGIAFGGSLMRKEATGFGLIYFAGEALKHQKKSLEGKKCLVSGAGNVATHAALKLQELGAQVLTLSDSGGTLYQEKGFSKQDIEFIKTFKERGGALRSLQEVEGKFLEKSNPWSLPADYAFPCATQNEVLKNDAQELIKNGIQGIFEGANMPVHNDASALFKKEKIIHGVGKAANAGGVGVSGLEMSQNSTRVHWGRERLDQELKDMMKKIHEQCLTYGEKNNFVDYSKGAAVAGFKKVADAMIAYGVN